MKNDQDLNLNVGAEFGKRLSELRKSQGISQRELAKQIGTSQRMIVYYEGSSNYIPANLLPSLSKILKVSTDELLGLKQTKNVFKPKNNKLWNKLRDVEKLSPQDQKAVLRYIQGLIKTSST